ncbi:MAG TPA: histidine kinase [Flavobacteriales bacterium]|nr:histidine kinase [Flavobacteriales bacterium]
MDSLKKVLKKTNADSLTVIHYLDVINHIPSYDYKAAIFIGNWAIEQSKKLKNPYLTALSYDLVGSTWLEVDNYIEANKNLIIGLRIAEKNKIYSEEAEISRMLAGVYAANEQEQKGFECLHRAVAVSKKHNLKKTLGKTYLNLASLHFSYARHYKTKDTLSLRYSKMGLPLLIGVKDSSGVASAYMVMAKIYCLQGKNDSSLLMLDHAEALIKKRNDIESYIPHLSLKAAILGEQKKFKQSLEVNLKGLELAKKYQNLMWVTTFYYNISLCYENIGDFKTAHMYIGKYVSLHDSLTNVENFAAAADIQHKYEREKKENEILKLNQDKKIAQINLENANEKQSQLKTFLASAVAFSLVLIALTFLLLKNIRARKKAYIVLQEKSEEVHKQTVQLAKQARLIAQFQSQMNPHFVFNALHNIQGLVITQEDKKATQQIQSLAQLMRKTFANAEKEEITIEEEISYLQKYIDFEMAARENKVDFQVHLGEDAHNVQIPPMMIQPFVENAIKHAELDKIENPFIKVLIEIKGDLLKIAIQDNGKGIKNKENAFTKLSHSMAVIKSRIELLANETSVETNNLFIVKTVPEIEAGTLVSFQIPLVYAY